MRWMMAVILGLCVVAASCVPDETLADETAAFPTVESPQSATPRSNGSDAPSSGESLDVEEGLGPSALGQSEVGEEVPEIVDDEVLGGSSPGRGDESGPLDLSSVTPHADLSGLPISELLDLALHDGELKLVPAVDAQFGGFALVPFFCNGVSEGWASQHLGNDLTRALSACLTPGVTKVILLDPGGVELESRGIDAGSVDVTFPLPWDSSPGVYRLEFEGGSVVEQLVIVRPLVPGLTWTIVEDTPHLALYGHERSVTIEVFDFSDLSTSLGTIDLDAPPGLGLFPVESERPRCVTWVRSRSFVFHHQEARLRLSASQWRRARPAS